MSGRRDSDSGGISGGPGEGWRQERLERRVLLVPAIILPDCGYSKHLVMAERSKAADCKSVRSNPHIGSNPVHEANINKKEV